MYKSILQFGKTGIERIENAGADFIFENLEEVAHFLLNNALKNQFHIQPEEFLLANILLLNLHIIFFEMSSLNTIRHSTLLCYLYIP